MPDLERQDRIQRWCKNALYGAHFEKGEFQPNLNKKKTYIIVNPHFVS